MRLLLEHPVLWFCAVAIALSAQTKTKALGTFVSPDGIFQFEYSRKLVDCMRPGTMEGRAGKWEAESCISQGGVCGDSGVDKLVACYAYPKSEFKDKPTFGEAAFFVGTVEAATEEACLEPSRYWNVEGVETKTINAIRFKVFHSSSAGLSHNEDAYYYRAFHRQKCFELGLQQEGTNPAAYDPGSIKEFTKQDNDEVQGRLKKALDSFKFIE